MLEIHDHTIDGISTIAHYQPQRLLARGGMSHIYLATDTETERTVAMKLVHSDEGDYCTRFQREVKAIAELHHDHILPAFDYGKQEAWCYMVMPYIEGGTLHNRLEKGPLSLQEASRLFTQLAEAVQCAHEHGILHRDIKPSNILLRDGEHVYLTDFGLVRHVEEESNITGTGYVMGTPEYMAPEQIEHPATRSSDIYALGVVLYQMLTGRVPFKGSSPIGTCWKHLHEQPTPPSTLNPAISSATEAVILRALEKNPNNRYQSARELAQAYQDSIKVQGVSSTNLLALSTNATRPIQITHRRRNVHPGMLALVALLMLFIMPTTLGFLLSRTYGYNQYNQIPTLLGASGSFFNGQLLEKPTPLLHSTPTSTTTPSTTFNHYTPPPTSLPVSGGSSQSGTPQRQGNGSHSGNHGHSNGNGHGNGHNGHGHGNGGGHGNGNGNGGGHKDGNDNSNSIQSTVTIV